MRFKVCKRNWNFSLISLREQERLPPESFESLNFVCKNKTWAIFFHQIKASKQLKSFVYATNFSASTTTGYETIDNHETEKKMTSVEVDNYHISFGTKKDLMKNKKKFFEKKKL